MREPMMDKKTHGRKGTPQKAAWLRLFAVLAVLILCAASVSSFAETPAENPSQGTGGGALPQADGDEEFDSSGLPDPEGDGAEGPSEGGSTGGTGMETNFDADDIPKDYLKAGATPGRVEDVEYITAHKLEAKFCTVYLPVGYDESDQPYNILYILHASNGTTRNYLNPESPTKLQRLLDHMIENGDIEPLIVVAATYYNPSDPMLQYMPLNMQVERTKDFHEELVTDIIPAVESVYRTYAASGSLEDIVASRNHRAIAGFSLGGVATWNVFLNKMCAFKWFLPISEASWDDGEGGTKGIFDSDMSAKALYDAVINQGYSKSDFMLFVATGGDDEASEITTTQMASLLDDYGDMFKPGENVECAMMNNGEHKLSALYTYLYHIMPSLFRGE